MSKQSFKKSVTFLCDEVEYGLMEQIMAKNIKRKNILSKGIAEYAKELGIDIQENS